VPLESRKRAIPGVKHIVAVASGKGGVGKSTIATNLAVGLQTLGHKVGMMDADVYGPSLPTMMDVHSKPVVNKEKRIQPVRAHDVACLSIGLVVDPEEAIIWRGPMIMGLLRQFIQDTDWGELDYLVVDLPPGTGDAQLSLIQAVPLAGAVIVTTPQDIALADAVRGITMFRKLDVPLLGLVENMAYYPLPDGTRDYVFGQDGGKAAAEKYGTELLAEVPLRTAIRRAGDEGQPAVLGEDDVADTFRHIATRIAEKLPV
jgi:ATP-binding protein involved in chromosome partitioning